MIVNTSGSHQESPSRTVAQGLWPFVPIGIATVSLSALLYYHFHQLEFTPTAALQHVYAWIYQSFGLAPSFLFFLLVLMWSTIWLLTGELQKPAGKLLRITAMAVLVGIFLNLGEGGVSPGLHKGALGAWLADGLVAAFGYVPSLVLVFAMTFASMLLATDFFFSDGFERLRQSRNESVFDIGVEDEVTERLRSLAGTAVGSAPTGADTLATTPVAEPPPTMPILDAAPDDAVPPEPVAELPRRRSSYFERRRERSGEPAEEEWVPPAPESTEIDNPESRDLAEPGPAAEPEPLVGTSGQDASNEVQDAWVAAESLVHEPIAGSIAEPARTTSDEFPATSTEGTARSVSDFGEAHLDESADEAPRRRWADAIDLGGAEPASTDEAVPVPEHASEGAPGVAEPEAIAAAAREPVDDADLPLVPEDSGAEAVVEPLVDDEPWVAIPRPEPTTFVAAEPPVETAASDAPVLVPQPEPPAESAKQQSLFGGGVDAALLQEATELVLESGRSGVSFLQRKLRIDYDLAADLVRELAARGVIAAEGGASQGQGRG
ncbi:MAG: hypothetical protein JNK15_19820 [Planctomycetes bacterium]|nr:hypothetical protein [Planctomycetota bacterium]